MADSYQDMLHTDILCFRGLNTLIHAKAATGTVCVFSVM